MKKYLKLSLITIFIFLIGIVGVNAEENVELVKVELQEKSEYVIINEDVSLDGNRIKSNVNFYDEGDYVVYKLTIKNNDNKDYYIEDIIDNNENEYLNFEYIYEGLLEGNSEKEVLLKITYKSGLPYDSVLSPENTVNLNTSVNISIKLTDEIPVGDTDNPSTFDKAHLYLILEIIGVVTLLVIFIKLKKKNAILLLLLAILLVPKTTKAKIELELKFSLENTIEAKVNFLKSHFLSSISGDYTKIEFVKKGSFPESAIDVSQNSDETIMAWIEDGTLYIGSRYMIFFPEDSTSLLSKSNLTEIEFNNRIDTTFVKNMTAMFASDNNLTELDVSSFRTGNVTNMNSMFNNCKKIEEYDLSHFDTSKVTTFNGMFSDNIGLKYIDLSKFDTSSAIDIGSMLSGCSNLEKANLDDFNLSKISNTASYSSLFDETTSLTELSVKNWVIPSGFINFLQYTGGSNSPIEKIDVTGWDLSNTNSLNGMFMDGKYLTEIVGLDTWDTSNIDNMQFLFCNCSKIEVFDISGFDLTNLSSITGMFRRTSSIKEIIFPEKFMKYNYSNIELPGVFVDEDGNNYYFINGSHSNLAGKTIKYYGTVFDSGYNVNIKLRKLAGDPNPNFNDANTNIREIRRIYDAPDESIINSDYELTNINSARQIYGWYEDGIIYYYSEVDDLYFNENSSNIFSFLKNVEYIDLTTIDTEFTTNFYQAFYNTGYNSNSIKVEFKDNIDVSHVQYFDYMFGYLGYNASTIDIGDISNWNLSSAYSLSSMFTNYGYNTDEIDFDLSSWDVSNVQYLDRIFEKLGYNATRVNLNINNWDLSNIYSEMIYYPFSGIGESSDEVIINAENLNISGIKSTEWMFYDTGYSAKKITINLKNWNTSSVTSLESMFRQISGGKEKFTIDLSGWDTSNVTNMKNVFYYTGRYAKDFTVIGINEWNTSSVTDMSYMFYTAGERAGSFDFDLSGWDVSNVDDFSYMFAYTLSAYPWTVGDISGWQIKPTAKTTGMYYLP